MLALETNLHSTPNCCIGMSVGLKFCIGTDFNIQLNTKYLQG